MAKAKDQDDPRPARKRSAVPDITEKMPQLSQLGDEDEEATRTDPGLAPVAPTAAPQRPAPPPPVQRKATPPARPAQRVPVVPKPPAPPPAAGLGEEEEGEHEATIVADQLSPHYSGAKAGLKPVFEAILEAARRLGQVKIIPGPQYVVLMRNREFAILEETPQGDRVELGLVLPGRPPTRRLNRARHFNWGDRFTHYVTLRYKTDVDSEVRSWLTDACWTGG